MERLTDCAQGYCEMYCKKYGHCFGDPGDCIFKAEIKMYDALKSIEGIVPFDRLLELADADRAGRLVVLPCKVGDTVYQIDAERVYESEVKWIIFDCDDIAFDERAIGGSIFLTREEAEAALAQEGGKDHARNPVSRKAAG